MKITVKLIVSLVLVATLVISVFTYLQVQYERDRLSHELDVRADILAESLQESVKDLLKAKSTARLKRLVEKFGGRDRLIGVAVYDSIGKPVVSSINSLINLQDSISHILESLKHREGISAFIYYHGKLIHTYTISLILDDKIIGALLVLHDASFIDTRVNEIWQANFVRLLIQTILIIITTALVVRWSIVWPIAKIAEWMRSMRTGKTNQQVNLPRGDILQPLADEVTLLTKSLAVARASAEEEARLRLQAESIWTAERLKEHVRQEVSDKSLIIVSNREPYMHSRKGNNIECIIPAGGLVTALDPILKACGGIWIAHGSGDADLEMADTNGRLAVPPDEPKYMLRRIFLTKEEEEGYYYGFSNEGIWPLCHITHTRPTFRLDDWINYQKVNQKFAEAIIDEIKDQNEPLIFIQDYHFALLPLLIKAKRPDAHVALFWHIPWPNPEAFGICPWKKEILLGLLGADLIGFHIQFHCNNFLETIDRFLESKINWEQFSVERRGGITAVKPFPISIAFSNSFQNEKQQKYNKNELKEIVYKKIGFTPKYIGVGVDRIDYTKGIVERFTAVERLLEKYPEYIGQFTFVELGAPSRTHIKKYHDLMAELDETVDKINWRFQTKGWKPIVFLKAHHSHEQINPFYKAVDLCMVTSLHDGMNLVAKEFVASRDDTEGVLILSQFTGASRELQDAIIVNPYSTEEMADSIHIALTMNSNEKSERMLRMRAVLKERNVYRWAANIITALSRVRISINIEEVEKT
jgi:trehalose-6-phosphate synthase